MTDIAVVTTPYLTVFGVNVTLMGKNLAVVINMGENVETLRNIVLVAAALTTSPHRYQFSLAVPKVSIGRLINWGGGQPDFSDFSDPDFGKINFHIGKIGKQFFANISLPDHFRAYVAS